MAEEWNLEDRPRGVKKNYDPDEITLGFTEDGNARIVVLKTDMNKLCEELWPKILSDPSKAVHVGKTLFESIRDVPEMRIRYRQYFEILRNEGFDFPVDLDNVKADEHSVIASLSDEDFDRYFPATRPKHSRGKELPTARAAAQAHRTKPP